MFKTTVILLILFLLAFILYGCYAMTQPILGKVEKIESTVGFEPKALLNYVNTLVKNYHPRTEQYPQNLDQCAAYIKTEFSRHTGRTNYQTFKINDQQYRNVIASFGPEEGERLIVGAHYDTAGAQPGADDNASGVASLLALAEKLSGTELQHRIDLVAYTLEEPPYFRTSNMGSAWHAAMLRENNVSVKLMIALEMLGYYSDEEDSQDYPVPLLKLFYPTKGNYIAIVGKSGDGGIIKYAKRRMKSASNIPVYSINAPRFVPGIDFSDHLSYWNEGYPAIMITDTAFYRNKDYHTGGDVPENLNYEKMAEVLKGVFNLAVNY